MQETGTEEIEEIKNEAAVSQSGHGENSVWACLARLC